MNVRKFLDLYPILYADQPKRKKDDAKREEDDTKADAAKDETDRENKSPGNKR